MGVVVFLRRPNGHFYMAKRLAKDRPFKGCYAAPGGTVERGEEPLAAGVREVKEETGLEIDASRLSRIGTLSFLTPVEKQGSGVPYDMHYFGVDLLGGEVPKVTEPNKQGEWEARSFMSWGAGAPLCPGAFEMMSVWCSR